MNKTFLNTFFCAAVTLSSSAAFAGARTYVSKTGNDANDCQSAATACLFFSRAIAQAGPDGEILCLDSGFFGGFNITFSVSIMCEGQTAQTGFNFNSVNLPAGSKVVLNGIVMDMRSLGADALSFTGAGTLIIHNSSMRNATNGIRFAPSGDAKLVITNTNLEGNNTFGLLVQPTGGSSAKVDIDGLKSTNNLGGVGTVVSGGRLVELSIRDSLIAGNSSYGVLSSTTGGASNVIVDKTTVSNNGIFGLLSQGANSFVLVSNSVIARHSIGWGFASGGVMATFGNNVFNNAGGSASARIGLQ